MNLQSLILDRSLPSFRSRSVLRIAGAASRPGRWDRANFVLVLACILAAATVLSAKLSGAEPCFQAPSGNCGQARQVQAESVGEEALPSSGSMPAAMPGPLRRPDALLAL